MGGRLSRGPQGAALLKLIGGLWGTDTPLIHGVLENGRCVTVVDAEVAGNSFNGRGYRSEEHRASIVWEGDAWLDGLRETVNEIEVRFAHLSAWLGLTGLSRLVHNDPGQPQYQVQYNDPAPIVVEHEEGTWSFHCSFDASYQRQPTLITISQHNYIKIIPRIPTQFESILGADIMALRTFLSLVTGNPADYDEIKAIGQGGEASWQAKLYLNGPEIGRPEYRSTEPYLAFSEIGDRLPLILSTWRPFAIANERPLGVFWHVGLTNEFPIEFRALSMLSVADILLSDGDGSWTEHLVEWTTSVPTLARILGDLREFEFRAETLGHQLVHLAAPPEPDGDTIALFNFSEMLVALIRVALLLKIGVSPESLDRANLRHHRTARLIRGAS